MNAKKFINQQGFGDINSKQRPINIEISNVAYLMEQYAEFKIQQANDADTEHDKCHIQNVSGSASDIISKMKHLPKSDYSLDGQLKLLRVCGNTLGLYEAVNWMQEHYR